MTADIFANDTTENGASDDAYLGISSQDAKLIPEWCKAVVMTERVAVTSNITDVFRGKLTLNPSHQIRCRKNRPQAENGDF